MRATEGRVSVNIRQIGTLENPNASGLQEVLYLETLPNQLGHTLYKYQDTDIHVILFALFVQITGLF